MIIKFISAMIFFSFLFAVNVKADDRALAKELIVQYENMLHTDDIKAIEEFYAEKFILNWRVYFKKKCGISCMISLSDKWKVGYENFFKDMNRAAREFIIVGYDLKVKDKLLVELELRMRSCDGQRSKNIYTYTQEGGLWRIMKISIGSLTESVPEKEQKILAKYCGSESRSEEVPEKTGAE